MSLYDKFLKWSADSKLSKNSYKFDNMRSAFSAGYALRNKEMKDLIQAEQDKCIFAEEELIAEQLNQIAEARRKGNN
jgi:hypothetical protein|tara:strand:- start:855 stop:1085 length:231 start_codon:yes stop_codon:yes gene_type:complete